IQDRRCRPILGSAIYRERQNFVSRFHRLPFGKLLLCCWRSHHAKVPHPQDLRRTSLGAPPERNLPVALPKEGAFAASNSNLLLLSENEVFVITGGFAARVLHTRNGGKAWSARSLLMVSGNASSGFFQSHALRPIIG